MKPLIKVYDYTNGNLVTFFALFGAFFQKIGKVQILKIGKEW